MAPRILLLALLCCALFVACGKKSGRTEAMSKTAVVAISGDADNFNPVIANSMTASEVSSAIFPMMFDVQFDLREGKLVYQPGLVKDWEFENDGKDVVLILRSDIVWEDNMPVTTRDVKFTYMLIGDPDVASPRNNYVESMIFTNKKFDPDRSIDIIDDTTMIFHFAKAYPLQLFHLNVSPIPYHIYWNADRKALRANPANEKPIGAGPFRLEKWTRQQEIHLRSNMKCTLPYPGKLENVLFRVITEPTTRLTELKKGTLDVMRPVYPEDVKSLQENPDIRLQTLPPRNVEYIGWANIDYEKYHASNGEDIVPHPLFGNKLVRQAMTYGIDRKTIMDEELGMYGELAITEFSPIFRWAVKTDLIPYAYNPEKARELLRQAGWMDTDGDGIVDKKGRRFEFTLHYNVGNKRREYTATVVQENLKQLGIKVNLQSVEPVVLFKNLEDKRYDAFIAGFSVALALDPSDRWGEITNPFNTVGFNHNRVNELLKLGLHVGTERDAGRFWKEIQAILHQEQPCTWLFWVKDIVGVNRRLKGTDINVFGVTDGMWDWTIGDPNASMTY